MFKNIHIIEYIYFRMCALCSIEKKEGRKEGQRERREREKRKRKKTKGNNFRKSHGS